MPWVKITPGPSSRGDINLIGEFGAGEEGEDNARVFISRLQKLQTFAPFLIESAPHNNGTDDITVLKILPLRLVFVPILFKLLFL
jgi:hypothetical protein